MTLKSIESIVLHEKTNLIFWHSVDFVNLSVLGLSRYTADAVFRALIENYVGLLV